MKLGTVSLERCRAGFSYRYKEIEEVLTSRWPVREYCVPVYDYTLQSLKMFKGPYEKLG